ncbi:hypothetical protein H4R20_001579 [Coemansia guatemalensis]|uniref:Nucleoside diphosphate kinase n=1 Tax=Coemansia guatemalensis TaxID=2761395 RepID=A0A9W8I335_9FUNG|nr:hypothetical protein H4R20_001579 [Coemansia guatemalensis]
MAEDQSADRTFALVKPDALTPFKYQQIDALIKLNEFEIVRQKLIWLTEEQATALFPERAADDDRESWLEYITGAPSLALELAKNDAPLFWQLTMGAEDPTDGGARDSDSIRGIMATDRVRNAVDGSQEPEDAVRQLKLVFSDAVPELPYDSFLMQRADDVRSTLALIKSDVSGNEQAVARIIGRAVARGYTVKDRVDIALSRSQAAALYAEHEHAPFFDDLIAAATSGPVIALLLEGDDVIRGWRMMLGPADPTVARQQAPQSLRALLGTDTRRNAVHGSESPEAAQRELGFFFFPRIQPEDGAADDKKKQKKKQKKRRSKRKQAVTVNSTTAPTSARVSISEDSDEEPEVEAKPELETKQEIATKPDIEAALVFEAKPKSKPDLKPEAQLDPESEISGQGIVANDPLELAKPSDPAYERTFALFKPDAYPRHTRQLLKQVLAKGLSVVAQEEVMLSTEVAERIYSDMATFPVFRRLVEFVTSAPVLALVLEGSDAIAVWRELAGPTNPRTAKFEARNSLRAKYGTTAQMNAVHASKDQAEARRSISAVFYDLLHGKFRVLAASDDPLDMLPSEAKPMSTETAAAPESAALVRQMETLAVAETHVQPTLHDHKAVAVSSSVDEKTNGQPAIENGVAAVATEASATEAPAPCEAAVDVNNDPTGPLDAAVANDATSTSALSEQSDTPRTPSQSKAQVADKPASFGGRLASSPFLKADRKLGQDAATTPKRLGRVKSPFLGSKRDEGDSVNTAAADKDETVQADESTVERNEASEAPPADSKQLHEELAELRIDADGLSNGNAEQAPAPASKNGLDSVAAETTEPDRTEQPESNADAANPPSTPSHVATDADAAKPAPVTPRTRAASGTVPRSAAVTRTVRRVPGAGPPAAAQASRRATLGPSATAPSTPGVLTRSAARAARAPPLAASAAPSTPTRSTPATRASVAASARPAARTAAAPVTPTRAPLTASRARAAARPSVSPASTRTPVRTAAPASARVKQDQAQSTTPAVTRRPAPASTARTPSVRTASSATNGSRASPARSTAAADNAAASPRPVTRSMTSAVPVASTAASRARAAAAAAAKAEAARASPTTTRTGARTTLRSAAPTTPTKPATKSTAGRVMASRSTGPLRAAAPTAASRARVATGKPSADTADANATQSQADCDDA